MPDDPTPNPAPTPDPAPAPDPALNPAPSPDPAPDPKADDWRAGITNPEARKLADDSTDLNHFAERTLALRQKMSNAIVKPGKDAKPDSDEAKAFRKAMGVPEKPEEYLKAFPTADGEQITDEMTAERTKWAGRFHAANVPADVAAQLIQGFAEDLAAQQAAAVEADKKFAEDSEAALKTEWGADYDKNKTYANRAAAEIFGGDLDAVRNLEDKTGRFVLDNPIMLKALAKIGREMGEGALGSVMSEGERETMDTQIRDLRKQIEEAQGAGDTTRANQLYQKEQALIAKRDGAKSIVGAAGRAA